MLSLPVFKGRSHTHAHLFNTVAAVSSTGLVTGVSAGTTHILASCAGIVDSVPVVVGS